MLPELPRPYQEMNRVNLEENLKGARYVDSLPNSNLKSELFSEYPVFWSSMSNELPRLQFGLFHYRCFLDLQNQNHSDITLDFSKRSHVSRVQRKSAKNLVGKIVLSKPLDFSIDGFSAWDQFVHCHPDAENDLIRACQRFELSTNLDAARILKMSSKLYSRNIFFAPIVFAQDWNRISSEILDFFGTCGFESKTDRPGGYILERLFSVWAMQYEKQENFLTRNFIYFRHQEDVV